RLLQPQHPREQRRRMHDVPRAGRSHAAHVAGAVPADVVVHRLPSPSRVLRPPARGGVPHRLRRAFRSGGARTPPGRRISHPKTDELRHVSSIDRPLPFDPREGLPVDPVERRTFLKLMGASLALGGFTSACTRQPLETIVPYVRQPEDLVLGEPLFFATAMPLGGSATGLLVESHEGRPTKIEGNPGHPGSLGAAGVFAQAAILSLYDPDRAQTITHLGEIQSWSGFVGAIKPILTAQQALKGAGVRLLTESVSSPTLAAQIRDFLKRFPSAKWHQWDPLARENAKRGAQLAFGRYLDTQYRIDKADVVVSLDADFLCDGPAGLRYAREFASRRRPEDAARMNRLYVAEGMPTSTGSRADHRLPRRPGAIAILAEHIAAGVGAVPAAASSIDPLGKKWADAVARDLRAHRGASVVIAGDAQPPEVHALAHAMNAALGNN